MKTEDLMLNDYVEIEGIGIAKVISITRSTIALFSLDNSKVIIDIDKIKPISITKTFLLNNNFSCNKHPYYKDRNFYELNKVISDNILEFNISEKDTIYYIHLDANEIIISGKIKYIHELQHILKMCRIKLDLQL